MFLFVAAAVSLFTFVVMQLWNWLLPDLIGVSEISFAQTMILLVLTRLIFGGLFRRRYYRPAWKMRMHKRMQHLSPEEREKFRTEFRGRCHHYWARREAPVAESPDS